jgi:hypothetical protein
MKEPASEMEWNGAPPGRQSPDRIAAWLRVSEIVVLIFGLGGAGLGS